MNERPEDYGYPDYDNDPDDELPDGVDIGLGISMETVQPKICPFCCGTGVQTDRYNCPFTCPECKGYGE